VQVLRLYVCVYVCLSLRKDISGTTGAILTKYLLQHVTNGRGSIFLLRMGRTLLSTIALFTTADKF